MFSVEHIFVKNQCVRHLYTVEMLILLSIQFEARAQHSVVSRDAFQQTFSFDLCEIIISLKFVRVTESVRLINFDKNVKNPSI